MEDLEKREVASNVRKSQPVIISYERYLAPAEALKWQSPLHVPAGAAGKHPTTESNDVILITVNNFATAVAKPVKNYTHTIWRCHALVSRTIQSLRSRGSVCIIMCCTR